jgi:hypothetical protein
VPSAVRGRFSAYRACVFAGLPRRSRGMTGWRSQALGAPDMGVVEHPASTNRQTAASVPANTIFLMRFPSFFPQSSQTGGSLRPPQTLPYPPARPAAPLPAPTYGRLYPDKGQCQYLHHAPLLRRRGDLGSPAEVFDREGHSEHKAECREMGTVKPRNTRTTRTKTKQMEKRK